MSVFDAEAHIAESVQSILDQTLADFEFILVDDGSSDQTPAILESFTDPRIVRVRNNRNQGLSKALNRGIRLARGEYLARQDADDVSLPDRLERQSSWLDARSEVGILGTSCHIIHGDGQRIGLSRPPSEDLLIRWACLLSNPFCHPSVMVRKSVLLRHGLQYNEQLQTAQDYDLWTRILRHTHGANIPVPLVEYRIAQGLTARKRQDQLTNHDRIALRTIREQVPEIPLTLKEVSQLRALFVGGREFAPQIEGEEVRLAERYYEMLRAFAQRNSDLAYLGKLKRTEARKVGVNILGTPLQQGWFRLMLRLLGFSPLLFFELGALGLLRAFRGTRARLSM